jgi:hypothetical protein
MVKLIKRKTDNKYLQSIESDVWVDNIKEAFEMTYRECEAAKTVLFNTYSSEQLIEIVDFKKFKAISEEEKQELFNLLKK